MSDFSQYASRLLASQKAPNDIFLASAASDASDSDRSVDQETNAVLGSLATVEEGDNETSQFWDQQTLPSIHMGSTVGTSAERSEVRGGALSGGPQAAAGIASLSRSSPTRSLFASARLPLPATAPSSAPAPPTAPVRSNILAQGWRAYESRLGLGSLYDTPTATYDPTVKHPILEEEDLEPPEYLTQTPEAFSPLIPPQSLYVYPSVGRGIHSGPRGYRDAGWIVLYLFSVCGVVVAGIHSEIVLPGLPGSATLFPIFPVVVGVLILSLFTGLAVLAYLLAVKDAVRHFVWLALVVSPVLFVLAGLISAAGAASRGAEPGLWLLAFASFVSAYAMVRIAIAQQKKVARTVKILELAATVILLHPPLILCCLGLSVLSAAVALPFLLAFVAITSENVLTHALKLRFFTLQSALGFATMVVYLWTLAVIRGVQKVTVAGVVGSWYFDRHDPEHPSALEVTRASFERARKPSFGTVIAATFLIAFLSTLNMLLRRLNAGLRSTRLPLLLKPLSVICPLLSLAVSYLDVYNTWVLAYVGLRGENFADSANGIKQLFERNGTRHIGQNLLTKLVLFITSIAWGLLAGLVAYLVASTKIDDPQYAPVVALLCFGIPVWTMRMCEDVIGDSADALFVAYNLDLSAGVSHSNKTLEAFGEPDSDVFV